MGTNPDFTEDQKYALSLANNVISSCSFIALGIFFFGVSLKTYPKKTFSLRLICNLFFAILLYNISNLLCNFSSDSPVFCQIEGAIRNFGCWSTVLWVTIMAYSAYSIIVLNDTRIDGKYLKMIFIGNAVPVVIALIPFLPVPVTYSYNGAYCLLVYNHGGTLDAETTKWVQFFLLEGWIWVALLLTTFYYLRLFNLLKKLHLTSQIVEIKRMTIFPLLFFLAFLPITINDLALFPKYHFALSMIATVTLHGLGVCYVFTYGSQRFRQPRRKITVVPDPKNDAKQTALEQSGFEFQGTVLVNALSRVNDRTERLDYSAMSEDNLKVVLMNTTL